MYSLGHGVKICYAETARWHRKATYQGEAEAQLNLSDMHCYGWGVKKAYVEAEYWYLKAANQRHTKVTELLTEATEILTWLLPCLIIAKGCAFSVPQHRASARLLGFGA